MKITAFDDLYSLRLSTGDTIMGGSGGSNSGFTGGDVLGAPGLLSVVGLRNQVSLSSNMGDNTVGTVLTTIQSSPWLAAFAVSSNTGSSSSNTSLRTTGGADAVTTIAASGTAKTLMVGGANYFDITLTANCTIGFTGWATSGSLSQIGVRTTEDGTGGWTPTFSGVTWIGGGGAPTHTTTAGTSTEYEFWTDNGGSTIIGGQIGTAVSISAGSNSTRVREISTIGASTTLWSPFDHAHDGIGTIISNSSNTLQRGTFNLKTGNNISFGLTDTDGDGEFDTVTIHSSGGGSGGGGGGNYSGVLWSSGTSMPGSPVTNQRVTRTDLTVQDYYWDGTRWVSVDLFSVLGPYYTGMTAGTAVSGTTSNAFRGTIPDLHGGSDYWLVKAGVSINVASGGTALGASHKWVLTIAENSGPTTVATVSADNGASGVNRYFSATVGALLGSAPVLFNSTWTKTGTPGNLIAYPWILYYRIVAT